MLGNIVSGGNQEEKRNFVSLIADSKKRTEYLNELIAAEKAYNKAKSEAEKAQVQAKSDLANAEAASNKVAASRQALETEAGLVDERLKALEEQETAFRSGKVSSEKALKVREETLKAGQYHLADREKQNAARTRNLDKRQAEIEALEALWAGRLKILGEVFPEGA